MADELDALTQQTLNDDTNHAEPERNSGHDQSVTLQPEQSLEAADSLDNLFRSETGEAPPVPQDPSKPQDESKAKDKDGAGDPPGDNKPDDIPDPLGEGAEGAGEGAEGGGDKGAEGGDKSGGDGESGEDGTDGKEGGESAEDEIDKVKLPPHTSEKAADSFNLVKQKAKEQIEAAKTEVTELKAKLAEFEQKETVTPEEKSELEELRKFRASVEIEKDPTFQKEFTERITDNNDTIYGVLKEAGMKDAQVESIKKYGGPTKLANWDDIYEHLTASQKRIVDGRLNDNDRLERDRDLKVQAAKENVDKYIQERDQTSKARVEEDAKIIQDNANEMLPQLEWTAKKEAPKNATAEQKKAVEEHNQYVDKQIKTLKDLLVDRSPANHATLAVGTIQALYFRKQLDAQTGELEQLRKDNKELSTKLNKIKKAGASSHGGGAPSQRVKPTNSDPFSQSVDEALDSLKQEVESHQ